jgi:FAD:protein FMN transferase
MKQTRLLMGMPITVEIVDVNASRKDISAVFNYFTYIDEKFSTYKETSEISKINRREIARREYSKDMVTVLALCEQTKQETGGYFNINRQGLLDPSGLVKGWAIKRASQLLGKRGYSNYYVDAGGDIEVSGKNTEGKKWRIGVRNPFRREENVKILALSDKGIATSGTAIRGQHIYSPYIHHKPIEDIVSLTVIGPDVYEADRFATAAFAMGERGIAFIEALEGFEGYMVRHNKTATFTSGFEKYVI